MSRIIIVLGCTEIPLGSLDGDAAAHPSKLRGALLSTLYMATSTSADWANQSTLQQTLKTRQTDRQTDAIACHVITPSADV